MGDVLFNNKHGYDVLDMHLCYNGIIFILHRTLVIINRFLPLSFEDGKTSMTILKMVNFL